MPLNPRDQRYLYELEAESIEIIREVAASYERPAILYSVGKDSSVLLRLAQKAFAPGRLPFPLIHIDTGYKFREMYSFRDQVARDIGAELIVHRNEDAIAKGTNPYSIGTKACCGLLKTEALLQVLRKYEVDAAIVPEGSKLGVNDDLLGSVTIALPVGHIVGLLLVPML